MLLQLLEGLAVGGLEPRIKCINLEPYTMFKNGTVFVFSIGHNVWYSFRGGIGITKLSPRVSLIKRRKLN